MAKRMKMSAKLMEMLERPRSGPMKPKARFDDHGRSLIECDTTRQLRLYSAANKLLATTGFFAPQEQFDDAIVLPSEASGVNGRRPTWHGRA